MVGLSMLLQMAIFYSFYDCYISTEIIHFLSQFTDLVWSYQKHSMSIFHRTRKRILIIKKLEDPQNCQSNSEERVKLKP